MNIILLNFLYFLDTTLELFLMKLLVSVYNVDNVIFNSLTRSVYLPYYSWKIYTSYKKSDNKLTIVKWYDVANGILDQFDIYLSYIALYGLTVGEYITYRTFSIFLTSIYIYLYSRKILPIQKLIGISLILIACIILLVFYNGSGIQYSIICLSSSVAYSLMGFLIEVNIVTEIDKELNFYWTKLISNIIGGIIGLVSEYEYHTITYVLDNKDIAIILCISFGIAILENYYYYLKVRVISYYQSKDNGSIIILFLDISRRFVLLILGGLFFNEKYNIVIFISLGLMFIGSNIGLLDIKKITNLCCAKNDTIELVSNC